MLLLFLIPDAMAQTGVEAAVAVADAIDKGGSDLLTGILGGGGGTAITNALLLWFLAQRGIISFNGTKPKVTPTGEAPPDTTAQIDQMHKLMMRRGDNDALYWPATVETISKGQLALLASQTAANTSMDRLATALEALAAADPQAPVAKGKTPRG